MWDDVFRHVKQGDSLSLLFCLRRGLSIEERDDKGNTLLHHAVLNSHDTLIRDLAKLDSKQINTCNQDFETPLMLAAELGNVAAVKFFIRTGADCDLRGSDARTLAHYAAMSGNVELLKIPEIRSYAGTPADNGYLPIMDAARQGRFDMVRALVDLKNANTDWQVKTCKGSSLLHLASLSDLNEPKACELVLWLFSKGLRLEYENRRGETVLDISSKYNKQCVTAVAELEKLWKEHEQAADEAIVRSVSSSINVPNDEPIIAPSIKYSSLNVFASYFPPTPARVTSSVASMDISKGPR